MEAVAAALEDEDVWRVQAWLHHNLIVLDYKGASVLQFNAILFAAVVFLASQPANENVFPRVALSFAVCLILFVIWQVMRFNWVYWTSTAEFGIAGQMLDGLLALRERRTRVVRRAWMAGTVALLLVSAVLLSSLTGMTSAEDARHQSAAATRPTDASPGRR